MVTGATGSGKSTTLAAMIDHINKTRKAHILTLEDPVEFVHESRLSLVNQREIGVHSQSFSRALKAALREDPDIVLVGEMRDLETVSLALETANTGHLVFGTLHTSTAVAPLTSSISFPLNNKAKCELPFRTASKGYCPGFVSKKKWWPGSRLEVLVSNYTLPTSFEKEKSIKLPMRWYRVSQGQSVPQCGAGQTGERKSTRKRRSTKRWTRRTARRIGIKPD